MAAHLDAGGTEGLKWTSGLYIENRGPEIMTIRTLDQILDDAFPELKNAEKRLSAWLNEPRKLICPFCYAPFKAVVDHDVDVFDVLCPCCSELR